MDKIGANVDKLNPINFIIIECIYFEIDYKYFQIHLKFYNGLRKILKIKKLKYINQNSL